MKDLCGTGVGEAIYRVKLFLKQLCVDSHTHRLTLEPSSGSRAQVQRLTNLPRLWKHKWPLLLQSVLITSSYWPWCCFTYFLAGCKDEFSPGISFGLLAK